MKEPPHPLELLSIKQIADFIKRHPNYVRAMKRAGAPIDGGVGCLKEIRDWQRDNPDFRRRDAPTAKEYQAALRGKHSGKGILG